MSLRWAGPCWGISGDVVHVQVNDAIGYEVKIREIENTEDDDSVKLRSF